MRSIHTTKMRNEFQSFAVREKSDHNNCLSVTRSMYGRNIPKVTEVID